MMGTPHQRDPGARAKDPLRSAVWSAAVASASLVAQHVAGKATRDTLFLSHFGLELLPAAMIGAALVSSVAVIGISRALGKYGPARIVPVMFGSSAALFLLEWWLSLHSERAAAVAVYVHSAIYGSAAVSAFWSLVNERFDPHSAKRIVGRIASGGTIGGVVGGVVVWRASSHLSVPMMLAVLAGINVLGLWGALRTVGSAADGGAGVGTGGKTEEPLAGGGWKIVRETPYLRDLALLVLAGAILNALLDWLLSAHATHEYGKGPALLGFFALFNMVVGVLSFIAQTSLSRPLLEWRGLAGTVKAQPVTVALCAVLALAMPRLATVVLLRGGEAVTRNSLYRSAYELFYTPLPTAKKRATKTIIDVGVDRVGTTIGSVALLAIVHLGPNLATRAVLIGALAMAALSWVVASRLHDGYVAALASSLKSGAVALGDDELADLTTRRTLAETTALLDRQQLLARIEQFQKTKDDKVKEKQERTTSATATATATVTATAAGTALGLTLAPVDPKDVRVASALDVSADAVAARVAALRTGDVARIKAALSTPIIPALTGFVIPLLADDAVVRDAVRALRKVATKSTGQLLDALLDTDVDARVRRRIPRVLKMCRTQRAADGLLRALRDPVFEVRVQVALGLKQMQDESHVKLPQEAVFDAVVHELTTGRASWKRDGSADDETMRGLAHVFTVLGLVLEREPVSIAYRALRSPDPKLRGTAFEYVEVVLPPRVRDVLVPLLGDVKPAARAQERGPKELADELLRSSASLARPVR